VIRTPVLTLLLTCTLAAAQARFDVVVYGATSGGVIASIAAAQQGKSVALLEPGRHVGGMISGGLGRTDMDRQQNVIGGMAREFFERVGRAYGQPVVWLFEPHVAEQTLNAWLNEAGVHVIFGKRLTSVVKKGARITMLETADGDRFEAPVYIDGTYEGDLMKQTGVAYSVGRESPAKYGESLAGRQDILPGAHQFRAPVSPYGPDGKLLPFITPQADVLPTGQGDGHVQSYCYRLCLTDNPANRIPIEKPENYDPSEFTIARNYIKALGDSVRVKDFLGISRLPNGKSDVNSTGAVSTDVPSLSWRYVEANENERQRIRKAHLDWAHGLLYFLAHDDSVPEGLRRQIGEWGLAKDEFLDTGHWPHQLYVRDARRMLGAYVLTQRDLTDQRSKADSIGMAGYNIDIREVQWIAHRVYRFPRADEEVLMEGYLSFPVNPWEIPYRALTPRESECANLLVPVSISASHVAFASFRMEPQFMIAGQAAGVAAALASANGSPVQRIDVARLQNILKDSRQILHLQP